MSRVTRQSAALLAGAAGLVFTAALLAQEPQAPQQPVFRAGTELVPVDVRVLDRTGKPVIDLKPEEITVLENGQRQQILHFGRHVFTPGEATLNSTPAPRAGGAHVVEPPNHRVFLIVLGRGRLQEPSQAIDALLAFVRDRLLPQDYVAVLAWNRATTFSQDHDTATTIVRRFREQHNLMEMLIRQQFSGLQALYGSRHLHPEIQRRVDQLFEVPGSRTAIPASEMPGAARAASRVQQTAADLQLNDARLARVAAGGSNADVIGAAMHGFAPLSFDDFVAESRQTMQDVDNIYTGIEYLRHIEGEKHLIFVTEQGINAPSADDDRSLAAVASDARVAIHTIQTGGVDGRLADVKTTSSTVTHLSMGLSALRTLAERTGGLVSISNSGDTAFNRILDATSAGYQIAYRPSNLLRDNRYRRIEVRVTRPGVRVVHRQGYFARENAPYDRREYLSYTRILAAGRWDSDIKDIEVDFQASDRNENGQRSVLVEGTVAGTRLHVTRDDQGRLVARLNLGVFCLDREHRPLGESWQKVDLTMTDGAYARLLKTGFQFSARVAVRVPPSRVKVVVYDYDGDLLGTRQRIMR